MITLRIHHAQPCYDGATTPARTIVIDAPFPRDDQESIRDVRRRFVEEGRALAGALCEALPGGTLDQLLAELMARRASLFVVPLFEPAKAPDAAPGAAQ